MQKEDSRDNASAAAVHGVRRTSPDAVCAMVFSALTVLLDGWLLTKVVWGRYLAAARPDNSHGWYEHRTEVHDALKSAGTETLLLGALVLLGATLGAAVAGRHATQARRWVLASVGAFFIHLVIPVLLVIAFLTMPPMHIPW